MNSHRSTTNSPQSLHAYHKDARREKPCLLYRKSTCEQHLFFENSKISQKMVLQTDLPHVQNKVEKLVWNIRAQVLMSSFLNVAYANVSGCLWAKINEWVYNVFRLCLQYSYTQRCKILIALDCWQSWSKHFYKSLVGSTHVAGIAGIKEEHVALTCAF